MMLNVGQWRMYHEVVCSPGLPWECEKRCTLWHIFENQRKASEGRPCPTYLDIQRKP